MPEDKQEEKTVDIDTSGPGADVELPEEKVTETTEVKTETVEPEKQVEEKIEVQEEKPTEEKQETKIEEKPVEEKPKEELEQYSEGVQKRIAKLTKKWREAERQKEAALDYAKGVQTEHKTLQTRMAKLEPSYVTAVENRVRSGMEAAKATLVRA